MDKWYSIVILGSICLASLVAAVILQLTGNDASKAWDAFAGLLVFLGGVHVPAPTQQH